MVLWRFWLWESGISCGPMARMVIPAAPGNPTMNSRSSELELATNTAAAGSAHQVHLLDDLGVRPRLPETRGPSGLSRAAEAVAGCGMGIPMPIPMNR